MRPYPAFMVHLRVKVSSQEVVFKHQYITRNLGPARKITVTGANIQVNTQTVKVMAPGRTMHTLPEIVQRHFQKIVQSAG